MPIVESHQRIQEQEWAGLIARTAQGDQTALTTLYDGSSPYVFGLVMRILSDREAAEEVTLDVYSQIWRLARSCDVSRRTAGSLAGILRSSTAW